MSKSSTDCIYSLHDIVEMLECHSEPVTNVSPLTGSGDLSRVAIKFQMCDMNIRVSLADSSVPRYTVRFTTIEDALLSESIIDDPFDGALVAEFILAFTARVAEMGL